MIIDEVLKQKLEEILFIKENLNPIQEEKFYLIMSKYLLNRSAIDTFLKNLNETVKFYELIGVTYDKMLTSIMKWPAIIHSDKNDLYHKYLLLAGIVNINTGECDRDNIFIEHPKDLMTGFDTIYARMMYFKRSDANVKNEYITRRKVFKTTNTEFKDFYGVSKEELLRLYPVNESVIEEIKGWEQNRELVARYESKSSPNRNA